MGQTFSQCTRARQQGFGFRNVNRQHAQVIYYSVKLGTGQPAPCQQEFLKHNWIHGRSEMRPDSSAENNWRRRRLALEMYSEDHVLRVHKHKRPIPDQAPLLSSRASDCTTCSIPSILRPREAHTFTSISASSARASS